MYIWNYVFNILQQKYWDTAYRTVPVFSKDLEDEMLGSFQCTPHGFNAILLAQNQGLSDRQLMGVLLHEMCHHAVFEQYGIEVEPHGAEWIVEMRRVGFNGEINGQTDGIDFFSEPEYCEILELMEEK